MNLLLIQLKIPSEKLTKSITETSVENNKALENLNKKVLDLMSDKGMIAPYLASSLFNLFKPENKSQFELTKDHISIRMNDFLTNGGIPNILISIMLTFRDSNKPFKINVELLETMTNFDFNVRQSNPQDQKLIYEFGDEMIFKIKQPGRKSNRDKTMIKLLNHQLSRPLEFQKFSSSDPKELCGRIK